MTFISYIEYSDLIDKYVVTFFFFFLVLFNWLTLSILGIWQGIWKWNPMQPRTGSEIFLKK